MKPQIVICIEGIPDGLLGRFLDGFVNTFHSSSLSFEPPYKWDIRLLTEAEKKAIGGVHNEADLRNLPARP